MLLQPSGQSFGELAGGCVTFLHTRSHRLEDDVLQGRIQIGPQLRWGRWRFVADFPQYLHRVADIGQPARQEAIKHDSQAVQIAPGTYFLAGSLLRRHERRGSNQDAFLGQMLHILVWSRQAEVGQNCLIVPVDENVTGFQVPVHQSLVVDGLKGLGHLLRQAGGADRIAVGMIPAQAL